jgi:hypothetical protein
VSQPLRTLETLRSQELENVQREVAQRRRELAHLRAAQRGQRERVQQLESKQGFARLRFAAATALTALRLCEHELAAITVELSGARAAVGRAELRVAAAEQRLLEVEARLRQHVVAQRAVSQVLEQQRQAVERRVERRAEDETDDVYRSWAR